MQKRRHLENSFQQTDPCCSTDAQPHAFLLTGPALPGTSSAASSPLKKEQPLFTLRQVGMICERLLKEREEKIREEYEEILTTKLAEQILYNIKQEYKRMQKRRHLENSFQQTDPCCSTDAQPHAFLLTGPALPGTSSAASSPLKKEQPLFTLRQVGMICERLLKEREEKIREEYEEILTTKLAEQYDAFVKFTHDQIMRRYGEQPASYVS